MLILNVVTLSQAGEGHKRPSVVKMIQYIWHKKTKQLSPL